MVRGSNDLTFPLLFSASDKAAAHTGAVEGVAELKDEQAGEEQAQAEQKEAVAEGEATATGTETAKDEPEAEPEDKHISYDDYLAQLAEKKLALEAAKEVRKPNEGSKLDKKWANAKPLVKDEEEDTFMVGTGAKAKRERERKTKQLVEIDNRYIEPDRPLRGGRGGGEYRGEYRGGRGGGERGGRGGRGGSRGGDHPRGGPRGGAGFRGGRGGTGGRGDSSAALNPADPSAFPSLGS
jgi:plasminogen activator inhibitor 1 RNA-binding protein